MIDMSDCMTNRRARIVESEGAVATAYRDPGTLTAQANIRERNDVETGRSLTGLSVQTAGGRSIRFTGPEARTLYRVLSRAVNG